MKERATEKRSARRAPALPCSCRCSLALLIGRSRAPPPRKRALPWSSYQQRCEHRSGPRRFSPLASQSTDQQCVSSSSDIAPSSLLALLATTGLYLGADVHILLFTLLTFYLTLLENALHLLRLLLTRLLSALWGTLVKPVRPMHGSTGLTSPLGGGSVLLTFILWSILIHIHTHPTSLLS